MPFASGRQRRAMYAAAHGGSNIGISRAAGRRFIRHAKKDGLIARMKRHIKRERDR